MEALNLRVVALAAAASALAATPAWARTSWSHAMTRAESPVCATTLARAGERAREARLKEAGELYALCARMSCSEETRRECAARRAQTEADTPSLVPLVTDDAGEPRVLVELRIDGALVTSRLDGRALPLDPGNHELTFRTDEGVFATRRLMVVQGERNRAIHVVLHANAEGGIKMAREVLAAPPPGRTEARASAPVPERERAAARDDEGDDDEPVAERGPERGPERGAVPGLAATHTPARAGRGAAPFLWGALGLAGVGGFGALTYWGRADNKLLTGCAPTCTDASVRHVRELYWAADASLGVGVVSLVVSTWLFASSGTESSAEGARPVSLDLRAARAGGVATVTGRF
jgi:hypothetical protein